MDFDQFHTWKRSAVLVAMTNESVVPGECSGIYKRLLGEGLITPVPVDVVKVTKKGTTKKTVPGYALTEEGRASLPLARRVSARLLNELVRENNKLVRKLVNQLFKQTAAFTEEEDLYQVGLMAFVKALSKFNPEKFPNRGLKSPWCTYLRHWIRDYVQKSTLKQQPIKHPKGSGMPYSVFRNSEGIFSKTGVIATAEQLGTYRVKGKDILITEEQLDRWRTAQSYVVPIDTYLNSLRGGSWSPWVQQDQASAPSGDVPDSSKNPESMYERAEQEVHVSRLIADLTEQERTVLSMMRDGDASNRKVSVILGCKDECARLFKAALIEKLKKRAGRTS